MMADIKKEIKSAFSEIASDMERRIVAHTHKTVSETIKDVFDEIEKAIDNRLVVYGFDPKNPLEMQDNMRYVKKLREGAEETTKWAKRSAMGIFILAALAALVKGINVGMIESANQIKDVMVGK